MDNLCASGATLLYELPRDRGEWGTPALPADDRPALPSETGALICHGTRLHIQPHYWWGQNGPPGLLLIVRYQIFNSLATHSLCKAVLHCTPEGIFVEMAPLNEQHGLRNALWGKAGMPSCINRCKRGRDSYKSSASEAVRRFIAFLSLPKYVWET